MHWTDPCIHLVNPKKKYKLDPYLGTPPYPYPILLLYPIIPFIISFWNPLKRFLIWFLLKPPNIRLSSKSYIIIETMSSRKLFPTPNPFNSGQNFHMGRDVCKGIHPLSRIIWMPQWLQWNNNPGDIHKADRITKSFFGENFQ